MATSSNNDFLLSTADLAAFVGLSPKECLRELESLFGTLSFKSLIEPQIVRRYLSSKGYQYPQHVVSFQMLKGGVAKTTSALNFGLRAAMYGARVLFIDLDQQANLSFALGVEDETLPVWIDIVEKKKKIEEVVVEIDQGVDLIPSSLNNSVLDRALLNGSRNWAQAVKGPLQQIKGGYDLVIIDTAPNLSAINTAVTCASDLVVLPINPDKFSVSGMKKHLADLQELKAEFDLKFSEKILFTKFDGRESASREILNQVAESFSDQLMGHYIRTSTDIKNTIGTSKTIFNTKSNAKEDYDLVTKELLGFLG